MWIDIGYFIAHIVSVFLLSRIHILASRDPALPTSYLHR